MKKHLIAAAVAATVAVPAMAQVTIGGNFDISYDLGQQNSQTGALNTAGAFTTSALTFGGSEDLGGGLSAYFNVNSRFGAGNQVEGAVGTAQAIQDVVERRAGAINFGDRGFQVGIKGSFGDIAVGKTTGTAIGGIIRGGVAGNFSLLSESLWGDRPNNMLSYTTPDFSGFSGRVVYQFSGGVPQSSAANGSYELSGQYLKGPLQINVAYNSVKAGAYTTDGTTSGTTSEQGSTGTHAGNDTGIRVQYNFGPAALNLSYLDNETAATTSRTQYSVGVTVPAGAWSFLAEYGARDAATNVGDAFYNVGAVYTLSKRTNIYGVYSKLEDGTTASRGLIGGSGAIAAANSADGVSTDARIVLGLRHSF